MQAGERQMFTRLENTISRNAFWEIWIEQSDQYSVHGGKMLDLCSRYGKMGTAGVCKRQTYPRNLAISYLEDRVAGKLAGDYRRVPSKQDVTGAVPRATPPTASVFSPAPLQPAADHRALFVRPDVCALDDELDDVELVNLMIGLV